MMKCESCTKYDDCRNGSGLTWPCGAYRAKAESGTDIEKLIRKGKSFSRKRESIEDELIQDLTTALSTLQAENEKLKRALAEMKKKPWSWRRRSSGQRYTEKVDGIWVVSCKYEEPPYPVVTQEVIDRLAAIEDILGDEYDLDRLRELAQADREGRCVVLNMPRKPLVWGDDDKNTCLCQYCGKDLMGIPYGERMVLQCPECGQYLDATKVITRAEAGRRREE